MIYAELVLAGWWIGGYVVSMAGASSWLKLFMVLQGTYTLLKYGKRYGRKKEKAEVRDA